MCGSEEATKWCCLVYCTGSPYLMQDAGGTTNIQALGPRDKMPLQRETTAQPWEGENYWPCRFAIPGIMTGRSPAMRVRVVNMGYATNPSPISLGIHTGMQLMSAGRCCGCHARTAHSQGQYHEQACVSGSRSIIGSWKKRIPSLSSMQALRPMRWFLSEHAPHGMHVAVEEKWREH